MSPVSRKRKPKKQRRSKPAGTWAPPTPRSWPWWPKATAEVLTGAARLLAAEDPARLEQATAELIGGVLHDELQRQSAGFALNAWLDTLIEEAIAVPGPPAMRLLHGIAAIAPRAQADHARQGIEALRDQVPVEPAWLGTTASIRPTGEVHLLRDAFGTRFGVVMACGYPNPTAGVSAYLLDVDMCVGVSVVVGAQVHAGLDEACAAWRAGVGPSASLAVAQPADSELLGDLLPTSGLYEPGVMGDESRRQMDNYYRMVRRADDLGEVLAAAGTPLPEYCRWLREAHEGLDIEPFVKDFQDWNAAQGGPPVDDAALENLADAWLEGSLPETRLACSPHRIRTLQEQIAVEWPQDAAAPIAELLPTWVRWCAERIGLDPDLTARALAAAEADTADWLSGRNDRNPRQSTIGPSEAD
jgi:hypothetical protein